MARKAKLTKAARFSEKQWEFIEDEILKLGVSDSQFIRESVLGRAWLLRVARQRSLAEAPEVIAAIVRRDPNGLFAEWAEDELNSLDRELTREQTRRDQKKRPDDED